ncbi:BgTH12-02500 [Blumeria graminis f. sp. triticale]|uniref:BgTH12-02500 n=1 Tax=Blumeria graminis f. sp. triticale TaxID=1689686 RepID=A0A9W4D5F3_BLUGR|nr:BgTH12-02500 [Blumeria graminis f. sp. triticale]
MVVWSKDCCSSVIRNVKVDNSHIGSCSGPFYGGAASFSRQRHEKLVSRLEE